MQGLPFVLLFVAMTFLSWGAYGPVLHHGTQAMGNDSLRAFVGVGLAYFFIAVIVPILILRRTGEKGHWSIVGTSYSILAGSVGAIGALGVILALVYKGNPVYVMPIVFGFAPIVNTLVTAWMGNAFKQISPIFIVGVLAAACGAGGVLAFKPRAAAHASTGVNAAEHDDANLKVPEVEMPPPAPDLQAPAPSLPTPATKEIAQDKTSPDSDQKAKQARNEQPESTPATTATRPSTTVPAVPPTPSKSNESTQTAPTTKPEPSDKPAPAQSAPAVATSDIPPQAPNVTNPPQIDPPKNTTEPKATSPQQPPPVINPPQLQQSDKSANNPRIPRTARYVMVLAADAPNESAATAASESTEGNLLKIILSIVMAAFCWGAYGPMLHQGQSRMGGSRLRPFICVGLAYFLIAVAAPLYIISSRASVGAWTAPGLGWSFAAGVAGALGALGIILAFNAGGKPFYVMPLVFGFAPVVNTFITLTESGLWSQIKPSFWISLAVVIAGAITVLTNAPKPKPHAPPNAK